ncbi:MAG TPA: TetR/AcrR family transcriptional regulator [Solirubrobacteraceae bacterium]
MSPSAFIASLRGEAGTLRSGPRTASPAVAEDSQRARLIAGMAEAAAEKGYTATTIADVVARAQVSRRTFYEHFADKDACFLAAYDASSDQLMGLIAGAVSDDALPWQERVAAGVRAYLDTLAAEPELTRLFLVEVLSAGRAALARRRAVHQRFAQLVVRLAESGAAALPPGHRLDPALALGLIGAVNELVLDSVDEGRIAELSELRDTAVTIVRALLAPDPARHG